jgi:hypothetical protein
MELIERSQGLVGLIREVQGLAAGVAARARQVGWVALAAAVVAWLTLFGRWAFDSSPKFVFFAVVLLLLLAPGFVLVRFARSVVGAIDTSDSLAAEVAGLAADGTGEVVAGLVDVSTEPGLGKLGSLLRALWRLKNYRGDFGDIISKVVGSAKLLNPIYLLWAGAAALGAGLVILLALVGLLVWVL